MTEKIPEFRSILFLTILIFALFSFAGCSGNDNGSAHPVSSTPTSTNVDTHKKGAEIVTAYQKAIDIPFSKGRIKMTVDSPEEGKKVYEAEVIRRQTTDQTDTLTHVVKPETESDLATLAIEKKGQKTENVSYAQSTSRFVEYDSSKQTFGGLTAQELLGGELDKYNFNYLGEKDVDGAKAYQVESTLKPNEDSPIARVITLFREDNGLPVEIHIFNSKGDEMRTFHVREIRAVDGHPITWKTEIDNLVKKTKITIDVLNISFPPKMDADLFTRDNLKRLVVKRA